MLKYLFAFVILLHGLIHFMGFAKAFGYGNIAQLTKDISKLAGVIWLITAILFVAATLLYQLKKESWPVIAIIAAILSQILIIASWKDAKFGTIANVIVLAAAFIAIANVRFNKMVREETVLLLSQPAKNKTIITREMLDSLPPIVQKWLTRSGIVGKEKIQFARLKQKGEMRTKPDGKWMPFTATQYFTADTPAFNWQATVQMMPLITMTGRDKFVSGNGEMLIKLLSLVNVAYAGADDKINSATMIRYLAETTWFPTAALNDYIQWETINASSAKATMTCKGTTVTGVMQFAENGDLLSFEADRYKDSGKDTSLEKWRVEITGYKDFQGMRIPYKSKVIWKLKSGDFYWANVELTDLEFNNPALYE